MQLGNLSSVQNETLHKFIERRHPEYQAHLESWNFFEATYRGGRQWFEKNLFQYLKEGTKEFKDRKDRAYRFNHTREVVDLLNKYIFKAEIVRASDAPQEVRSFWDKATLSGKSMEHVMRLASRRASVFGRTWIVVDSTAKQTVRSVADAKSTDARCYCYTLIPQNVLDMAYGDDGALLWFLARETVRDDKNPITSDGKVKVRYRLWTRNEWALFTVVKKDSTEKGRVTVKQGYHNLGVVPIVPLDHEESDEQYVSPPLVADIAYMDRAVANYLSNLDAIIQDQTFSQLTIPSQAIMPSDKEHDQLINLGTKRIFSYNGEAGQKPEYISPDVKQATLIIDAINKIIAEIYHSVGMAGERTKQDNSMGIDNSSGVAKAYDFERMNSMLANKANALQLAEVKIAELVMVWHGKELTDTNIVTYPETFDVRSLVDEFDTAVKLSQVQAPKELRRLQMKALASKMYPHLEQEVKDKINKEIEGEWLEVIEGQTPQDGAITSGLPGKKNSQGQVKAREIGSD